VTGTAHVPAEGHHGLLQHALARHRPLRRRGVRLRQLRVGAGRNPDPEPEGPGQILKTIYIEDGQFQPPGTPARVNQATDFGFQFNSVNGTFTEYKGARP
jgi:hypothetical protein